MENKLLFFFFVIYILQRIEFYLHRLSSLTKCVFLLGRSREMIVYSYSICSTTNSSLLFLSLQTLNTDAHARAHTHTHTHARAHAHTGLIPRVRWERSVALVFHDVSPSLSFLPASCPTSFLLKRLSVALS